MDDALAEIERLPGRHLYFLDDHLFGDRRFAVGALRRHARHGPPVAGRRHRELGARCRACWSRRWTRGCAACSSDSKRSTPTNLAEQRKYQNMRRDYGAAIRRLHDLGVMVNGSFVFGMDGDDGSVFERTVEWAIEQGIETATFHILTPYPGHGALPPDGRRRVASRHDDWDLYDTRHAVFRPARMTGEELERGYRRAYREFYRWRSIARGAAAHDDVLAGLRHVAYAAGWKKFEPLWDLVIRAKRAGAMLPVLETILSEFGRRTSARACSELIVEDGFHDDRRLD